MIYDAKLQKDTNQIENRRILHAEKSFEETITQKLKKK
jgi:hypothetical protein